MNNTAFADHPARLTYSPVEVAKALGISRTGIFALMRTGQLPSVKLGRRTLVKSNDIKTFLDGLTPKVTPKSAASIN